MLIITSVALHPLSGRPMELGDTDQVPSANDPAVNHQLQQYFWSGAQAVGQYMRGTRELGVASAIGVTYTIQLIPIQPSRISSDASFLPQHEGNAASMLHLVIACHEGNPALFLKLAAHLTAQRAVA